MRVCKKALSWKKLRRLVMSSLNEFATTIRAMPHDTLFATLTLAAFGLAAFAIYAVLTITKERR
jgi:hypothetical protein